MALASAVTYESQPSYGWANGRVYAMARDGDRIIIGGTFTRVEDPATGQRVRRDRLAAFDATTGELVSWDPGADGAVRSLAVGADGVVYAGGAFTVAGGISATRIVAIGDDGAGLPEFSAAPGGVVRDLAVVGEHLFIAGNFGRVNGVPRVGVAKLDPQTGSLVAWNARVGQGRVVALAPDPVRNQLVVGGNFKRVAGVEVWFLAGIDLDTGIRTTWTPPRVCDSCNLLDLVLDGDTVYGAAAGGGGGRAAAWSTTLPSEDSRLWVKRGDGDAQAVDYRDGVLYVGGHFAGDFDGFERHQFVALDAVNGSVLPYTIPFTGNDNPGIWVVRAEEGALRIGGGFQGIEGSTSARYSVLPAVPPPATP